MPKGFCGFQKGHKGFGTKESYKQAAIKISLANKGRKVSDETRKKQSLARLGKPRPGDPKNWKCSEETKMKFSIAQKGKPILHLRDRIQTKEEIEKMRQSIKEGYKNGRVAPLTILRQKNPNFGKGENHYAWKKDRTQLAGYFNSRGSSEYSFWRRKVLLRDDYRCMICGEQKKKEGMEVDHIYSFTKYPRLRYQLENGQTLCRECHKIKTVFEKRKNTNVIFATSY